MPSIAVPKIASKRDSSADFSASNKRKRTMPLMIPTRAVNNTVANETLMAIKVSCEV